MVVRLQTGHLAAVGTFEVVLLLKICKVVGTQAFVSVFLMGNQTLIVKGVEIKELKIV